jgi:hypothetical protein
MTILEKKRQFFVSSAILLFLLLTQLPTLSHGQNYQHFSSEMERIRNARLRFGPFAIFPRFQIDAGHDNNVYLQPEEAGPISDFTSVISPTIDTFLPVGRSLILGFSYNPEYHYYAQETDYRSFTHSFSPNFRLLLLHSFILVGDYHNRKYTRLITAEFDRRIKHTTEGFNLGLYFETLRGTAIGLSGTVDELRHEDVFADQPTKSISNRLDREEKRGGIEFLYRVFSESFFFIKGQYSEYNFESPDYQWRNSYSYEVNSGIRFPLLGKIRGTLSLGYMKFIPREKGRKQFSGLTGNTDLNMRYRRFGLRFSFMRGPQFSYLSDAYYFIGGNYRTGISIYITQSLRFDYDYTDGRMKYSEPLFLPRETEEAILRKDRYHTHSVGLAFRIFENTGLGITLNFWSRSSNYPGVDRNKNYIGGYLTYEF